MFFSTNASQYKLVTGAFVFKHENLRGFFRSKSCSVQYSPFTLPNYMQKVNPEKSGFRTRATPRITS